MGGFWDCAHGLRYLAEVEVNSELFSTNDVISELGGVKCKIVDYE